MEKSLWKYFQDLCALARPSGHTDAARSFLLSWAAGCGFESHADAVGNVVVRVPASPGRENSRSVCLQAHMDMVPKTAPGVSHDWTKDPVITQTITEDGRQWLAAVGTTLGADDGIGVAAAMAAAVSAEHGPLELLFTVDEEINMVGAEALTADEIDSRLMINLDSEQEGEISIGGAGGNSVDCAWKFVEADVEDGDVALRISLKGLKGGHSGLDIHLERANALKVICRVLRTAIKELDARLVSINAGNMRTAIPTEAVAVVTVPDDAVADMIEFVRMAENELREEYGGIDDDLTLDIEAIDTPSKQIPEEVQDDIINAVCAAPNGVFRHIGGKSADVEASLNHSYIVTEHGCVTVGLLLRSARPVTMCELQEQVESLYSLAGAEVIEVDKYVGWTPNYDSELLSVVTSAYESLFSESANVKVMHAGLECGIILAKKPELDIVSFGPTIRYPHSTGEKVDISSVSRFVKLLQKVLADIN